MSGRIERGYCSRRFEGWLNRTNGRAADNTSKSSFRVSIIRGAFFEFMPMRVGLVAFAA